MGGARERTRRRKIREYVISRDGLICCYCNIILIPENVTLDHIVPESKKGTFNSTNLTVSCHDCNHDRGDIPFFDYCKNFNFSEEKILKYKILYSSNLKIKVLNIAKEECITNDEEIPLILIRKACHILKIKCVDFSDYEKEYQFDIRFSEMSERRKIKFTFEQLIKIIEGDSEI